MAHSHQIAQTYLRSPRVPLSFCTPAGWPLKTCILGRSQVFLRLLWLWCARPFQPTMLPPEPCFCWWLCAGRARSKPCACHSRAEPHLLAHPDEIPNHVSLEAFVHQPRTGVRSCACGSSPAACTTQPASGQAWHRGGAAKGWQGAGCSGNCLSCGLGACLRSGIMWRVWWSCRLWRHSCLQTAQKVLQVHLCARRWPWVPWHHFTVGTPAPQHWPLVAWVAPPPSQACVQRRASAWFTSTVF